MGFRETCEGEFEVREPSSGIATEFDIGDERVKRWLRWLVVRRSLLETRRVSQCEVGFREGWSFGG